MDQMEIQNFVERHKMQGNEGNWNCVELTGLFKNLLEICYISFQYTLQMSK